MGKLVLHPLAPLLLFSMALAAVLAMYLVAGFPPSTTFEFAASASWSLLLALWIVADARRQRQVPCFDFGLFCYLFLPLVVPWYCFWSRGWRGTFLVVVIVGLWMAPYLIGSAVWLALYG